MESKDSIKIVLASDQNYFIGLWVTLVSLLCNTRTKLNIDIYIFDGGIDQKSKKRLYRTLKKIKHNISINWQDPQIHLFKNFLSMDKPSGTLCYSRIIIPKTLGHLDKAIWLDVDLLVLMDIELLWNYKLDRLPLAAAVDAGVPDYSTQHDIQNIGKYSISKNDTYFNTGVLLMDIQLLKEIDFTDNCLEYLRNESTENYRYFDQSAINVIMNRKIKVLNELFNIHNYVLLKDCKTNTKPEMKFLLNNQFIYHLCYPKPWVLFTSSFSCELFYFYLKKHKYPKLLETYFPPIKHKSKIFLKRLLVRCNYGQILDNYFNIENWTNEIKRFDFIRNTKTKMHDKFHKLSQEAVKK